MMRIPIGFISYNIGVVYKLIDAAFSDEDLSNFCFEKYEAVYNQFTAGQLKGIRVRLLIEHVQRHALIAELLNQIKEINPNQYQIFEPHVRPPIFDLKGENRYRVIASTVLLVMLIAAVYTLSPLLEEIWPDALPLITTPRTSDEYLVLVADYKGQQNYEAGRRIFDLLSEKTAHLAHEGKLRIAWQPGIVIDTSSKAIAWGQKHAATAVIWGWYDDAGIQSYFQLININFVPMYDLAEEPFDDERSLKQYVRTELPTASTYLTLLGLGLAAAYQGDSINGLDFLDLAEDLWFTVSLEEQQDLRDKGLGQGDLRWYRAWIYSDVLDNDQQAIIEYKHSLEIEGPHVPLAHYQLAMAYKRLANWSAALEHLEIFTELGSNESYLQSDAYKHMGDVLHELNRSAEAERAYENAMKLSPKNAAIPLAQGWYAYQREDLTAAESYYLKAISLDPASPWPQLNLALIYILSNKKTEAIRAYQIGIQLGEQSFLDPISEYQTARKDLNNLLEYHPEASQDVRLLYEMLDQALKE